MINGILALVAWNRIIVYGLNQNTDHYRIVYRQEGHGHVTRLGASGRAGRVSD